MSVPAWLDGQMPKQPRTHARPERRRRRADYEQARDELVQVVARLEAGSESLEGSLALWERGEALAARCQQWLDGARERLAAVRDGSSARRRLIRTCAARRPPRGADQLAFAAPFAFSRACARSSDALRFCLVLLVDPLDGVRVVRQVLAALGVEHHHLGRVEPQRRLVAVAHRALGVEGDDELRAHALPVEVAVELLELARHVGVGVERHVGVEVGAEPLGDVDRGLERDAPPLRGLGQRRRPRSARAAARR